MCQGGSNNIKTIIIGFNFCYFVWVIIIVWDIKVILIDFSFCIVLQSPKVSYQFRLLGFLNKLFHPLSSAQIRKHLQCGLLSHDQFPQIGVAGNKNLIINLIMRTLFAAKRLRHLKCMQRSSNLTNMPGLKQNKQGTPGFQQI